MKIYWKKISDPYQFVVKTLQKEANDIPLSKLNKGKWILGTIDINKIKVDKEMIARHNKDTLHIKRKKDFIDSMRKGKEIPPLIVLGDKLYLVDGYARYRALISLKIQTIKVLKQEK